MSPQKIGPETLATAVDGVLAEEIGGETVILDPASGQYARLNRTGTQVWRHLRDEVTARGLAQSLSTEFGIAEERALEDVVGFLRSLERRGLIALASAD